MVNALSFKSGFLYKAFYGILHIILFIATIIFGILLIIFSLTVKVTFATLIELTLMWLTQDVIMLNIWHEDFLWNKLKRDILWVEELKKNRCLLWQKNVNNSCSTTNGYVTWFLRFLGGIIRKTSEGRPRVKSEV